MAFPRLDRIRLSAALVGSAAAALLALAAAPPGRAAAASRVAVGVYIPGADRDPALLDRYANEVGRQAAIVHAYRDWFTQPFEAAALSALSSRGGIPLITWEPWVQQSEGVSLWEIASGSHDAYIVDAARAAAAWGGPLFVRFAHEMNGDWYPWARGNNGNTAAAYRAAWRHIVRIFRWVGATNVRWVWTPYVDSGTLPFKRFYPGDRWVDWAGFDGFNWGSSFVSFAKIFARSYRAMAKLTSKPLMIAETGSIEYGGDKAVWVRRALRRALPRFRQVHALLWWSDVHPKGADCRIDTSIAAVSALGQALRAPRFGVGQELLLRPRALATRR